MVSNTVRISGRYNNDGKYTADADRKIIGYEDPAYRFSIGSYIFQI